MKKIYSLFYVLAFFVIGLFVFSCQQQDDSFIDTPPSIEDQIFSIDENSPNTTVVDTVVASDVNSDQTLTYSIISGNFEGAFEIDSLTGVISVNNSNTLDYESQSLYELGIKVTDSYDKSLSSSAKVTINVNNVNEIPLNGLMAYYPFNGNANDESGNVHNGTVYGATLTTDRYNNANSAYAFDGINDYINTFSTFDYNYRTVSFWVNSYEIHGTGSSLHCVLVQDSYANSYGSVLVYFDDGFMSMNAGGANSINVRYYGNSTLENNWYHLVLVRNGSQSLYYINGDLVYVGEATSAGSTASPNPLLILGVDRTTAGRFFSGKIDDLAIYNRVLTEDEINVIYREK